MSSKSYKAPIIIGEKVYCDEYKVFCTVIGIEDHVAYVRFDDGQYEYIHEDNLRRRRFA